MGVDDLLPGAIFRKVMRGGIIPVLMGVHVGPACADIPGGIEGVIEAGPYQKLLPVVPKVGTSGLRFEVKPPIRAEQRMISDIVQP